MTQPRKAAAIAIGVATALLLLSYSGLYHRLRMEDSVLVASLIIFAGWMVYRAGRWNP